MDEEEKRWVERCRAGDREAFRPLVERYHARVFRLTLRIAGERAAAQDLTQEAFLKAYAALTRYDAARPFSSWLFRIAVNLCIDRRRRSREVATPELEPPHLVDPTDALAQDETRRAVQAALGRLSEKYRVVLILKDVEGMDYQSIAEVLGDSVPALKIRVLRGREQLAKHLRKMYPQLLADVVPFKKAL